VSICAFGQTHNFPATDTNNTWTGTNNFTLTTTFGDVVINGTCTGTGCASGGGGGYTTIQNASIAITQRTILNVLGALICSDNAGTLASDCKLATNAAVSNQYLTGIDANGNFLRKQIAYSELSGAPQLAVTKTAVTSNWLRSYDSTTGLFTASQPAYTDITGTPTLPATLANAAHKWLNSYSSVTGLFTQTQPDYTDLTSLPQLAVTKAAVASNWIRSYDSTTGLFTASQPAFTDISGVGSCAQEPALTGDITSSGCAATIAANAVTQGKVTNGYVDLSTTQASIAGAKTFTGVFTADTPKSIGNVLYAAQFGGGSTTCGVQEAYNALPSAGGKIILQQGNCSGAGWPVTIKKPVVIEGQGMGGPIDAGFNSNVQSGSSLTNTSTGGSFFIITIPGTTGISAEGMTFRDFAMIGNKQVGGATAGDCVDMLGGTATEQIRAIRFDNIQCNQPKGVGFLIQDNAFIITFVNTHVDQSGSHCFVIQDGPNGGVVSQIHIIASVFDLCGGSNASFLPGTADGIHISGVNNRAVEFTDSTAADSNNGIFVVAGAINSSVHVSNSDFETNTTCDVSLNDGLDHRITSSTLFGTGTGARGVCTAMPVGAAAQNLQLFMDGNWLGSHTVQDITIGANQKTCFILPQMANNYTMTDSSGHCVRMDVNQFGILNFTAAEVEPAANGTTALGDAAAAWSNLFTFTASLSEQAAPGGAVNKGVMFADSGDHMVKYKPNNGGEQHVPQVYRLTAQYTNSTTGFTTVGTPSIAFPVNASQSYTATCHLYYQAASTGGLGIEFTGPASPTAVIYGAHIPISTTTFAGDNVATAFGTTVGNVAVTTATTNFDAVVSFSLANGANAGTVTLLAKSAAAVQLQIQIGSFCQVQ